MELKNKLLFVVTAHALVQPKLYFSSLWSFGLSVYSTINGGPPVINKGTHQVHNADKCKLWTTADDKSHRFPIIVLCISTLWRHQKFAIKTDESGITNAAVFLIRRLAAFPSPFSVLIQRNVVTCGRLYRNLFTANHSVVWRFAFSSCFMPCVLFASPFPLHHYNVRSSSVLTVVSIFFFCKLPPHRKTPSYDSP